MRHASRIPIKETVLCCSHCGYYMMVTREQWAAWRESKRAFCSPKCQRLYNTTHDDGLRLL